VLSIDSLPRTPAEADRSPRYEYVDRGPVPGWLVAIVRWLLGSRLVMAVLRRTRLPHATLTAVVPFSSYLFINAGITTGRPTLARALYQAWNDDRTHNTSFGVRITDYATFHDLFFALLAAFQRRDRAFSAYFTGRHVGAQDGAYLGASFQRPVVMLDIHVPKEAPAAQEFLRELDRQSRAAFPVRPHWGKELFASADELRGDLLADALAAMQALKGRLDPEGKFSSPFTRRVLGF
jgi:hypothetical protein